MNKITLFVLLLVSLSTFANAWYCESYSPSFTGWGEAGSLRVAQNRAFYNCRANTPNYQICSRPSCW